VKHRDGRPIVVTGAPRSGSTFVGNVLASAPGVGYVHEPFNNEFGLVGVERNFPYVWAGAPHEATYRRLVDDLLAGKARFRTPPDYVPRPGLPARERLRDAVARPLVRSRANFMYTRTKLDPRARRYLLKDPFACFSLEWLHRSVGTDAVVLLRHPAAYVDSMLRMGWAPSLDDLRGQPELLARFPTIGELVADRPGGPLTVVESHAVWWVAIYSVLLAFADANPAMVVVRHEDLALEPVDRFAALFSQLDLELTDRVRRGIAERTGVERVVSGSEQRVHVLRRDSASAVRRWRERLDDVDVACIAAITGVTAAEHYPLAEW
jgi:hypothetical protein